MALRISLNNNYTVENNLTFNNIPTIVKIEDVKGGTKSKITITIQSDSTLNENQNYYINFGDVYITGTFDVKKAKNSIFLLSKSTNIPNNILAFYLCRALRATRQIASKYRIYMEDSQSNIVTMEGIEDGFISIGEDIGTNLPSSCLTTDGNAGTSLSSLDQNEIMLDIYAITDESKQNIIGTSSPDLTNYTYIAQLSKIFTEGEIKYDISPILSSLTDNGKIAEYQCIISAFNGKTLQTIGNVKNNYAINGYRPLYDSVTTYTFSNVYFLQDFYNGNNTGYLNKMKMYIGLPEIQFIMLRKNTISELTYKINYLDKSKSLVFTENKTINFQKNIHLEFQNLDKNNFENADYIELEFDNYGKIIYEILKPFNYQKNITRIYWYNSFGGISFFDFAGNEDEEFNIEKTNYDTSSLNYFDTNYSSEKTLNTNVIYNYTLSSHIIDEDSTFIFDDLMKSNDVFLLKNNVKYNIIITECEKNKQNVDNLYICNIKYNIK